MTNTSVTVNIVLYLINKYVLPVYFSLHQHTKNYQGMPQPPAATSIATGLQLLLLSTPVGYSYYHAQWGLPHITQRLIS